MGRTTCTEPQCLYKGALYLIKKRQITGIITLKQFYVISKMYKIGVTELESIPRFAEVNNEWS